MTDTKFCKNCKFCKRDWFGIIFMFNTYHFAKCTRSPKIHVSASHLVTGRGGREFWYCSTERTGYSSKDCGPEAKYYEGKS